MVPPGLRITHSKCRNGLWQPVIPHEMFADLLCFSLTPALLQTSSGGFTARPALACALLRTLQHCAGLWCSALPPLHSQQLPPVCYSRNTQHVLANTAPSGSHTMTHTSGFSRAQKAFSSLRQLLSSGSSITSRPPAAPRRPPHCAAPH